MIFHIDHNQRQKGFHHNANNYVTMYYYSLDGVCRMCPCDEIAYWAEVCESLRAFPALNVVKIIYSLKNYYFCDVSY